MSEAGVGWTEIAQGAWCGGLASGPVAGIVGGVHGDEPAGVEVIESLKSSPLPTPEHWQVRLVVGNPRALEMGCRHVDSDLNRAFGPEAAASGYEAERVQVISHALAAPRVLLDLHQTHCDTPPLAVVRDTPAHLALARALGLGTAVVDARRIYGDTMLADWVDGQGGLGLTIESGRVGSRESVEAAKGVVDRLLSRDWDPGATIHVYAVRAVLRAPWSGLRFKRALANGSPVARGEVLAERDGALLLAPADGVVLLPHDAVDEGAAAAIFAEDRGTVSVDHRAWQVTLG